LPFEPDAHRRLGGPPCTYVGHPLIERLGELTPAPGERPPLGERPTLLVLPGSRRSEISRLMAPFGEAVRQIAEARPGVELLLPAVPHLEAEIRAHVAKWPRRPEIVRGEKEKFAAFRRAHAALAASGTVSLELGLAGVPTVIAYRIDPIARALKPYVLKVPSFVLTNLILGENAVPEFLNDDGPPEVLARETLALLSETPARDAQLRALHRLADVMALPGGARPSDKAAAIVVEAAEHAWGRRKRWLDAGGLQLV
jgi:lipid-A-disaccharide synthase